MVHAATLKYGNDSLRRLVGPLGALKRKIEEETGLVESLACLNISFLLIEPLQLSGVGDLGMLLAVVDLV